MLLQSARELLKNGQAGSGTDLAAFMLDVYDQKGEQVSDESRGRQWAFDFALGLILIFLALRENYAAYCVNWT